MKIFTTAKFKALAAILGLVAAPAALAGEEVATGYVMNFFVDSAYGAAIDDGAFEEVIDELGTSDTRAGARVATQMNLCVAFTKTNQIDKATEACDAALARAGKDIRGSSVGRSFREREARANAERAMAFINRGVLHAVTGDSEQARAMFETAGSLDSRNGAAETNLLILQREFEEGDS